MKEIIDKIKASLTGDVEKDKEYLFNQIVVYKENKKVLEQIYLLLFDLIPTEERNRFIAGMNMDKFSEHMKDALELLKAKKYEKVIEYLNDSMRYLQPVHEDDNFIYMTFHNAFEAYYFATIRTDGTKVIKNAELDFGLFFKLRGVALANLKRYDEAKEAFTESLIWNPLDFEAVFEYMDLFYQTKDYETYFKMANETLKNAYTNYYIAMCYHNMGKYYMTKGTKEYDTLAYQIISYSISFDETDWAYSDLNKICEKYKWEKKLAEEKDVLKAIKKYNLPEAPDEELVKRLIAIAQTFMNKNDEFALQVFKLVYQLTHDPITEKYIEAGTRVIAEKKKQGKN